MTVLTITLCAEDQERFDVLPVLVLDIEALKDVETDRLEELDQGLGMAVAGFLPYLESSSMALAQMRRVAVWLALQLAGKDVSWEKCKPKLLRTEFDRTVDAASPPVGASEHSSEDAALSSS